MAAKDRYSYKVKCPDCGSVGVIFVSEEDHPYIRTLDHRIEKIDGDFKVSTEVTSGESKKEIVCITCQVIACEIGN